MTLIVNDVKKVVKKAEESLKIKPRLGKAVKKLKVRGRGFEIPEFDELPVSTYIAKNIDTCWEEKKSSVYLSHEKLFDIAHCNLPNSSQRYFIVDRLGLIGNAGKKVLSVREMGYRDRKAFLEKVKMLGLVKGEKDASVVRVHNTVFSMDVGRFFKRYGERWLEILDLYCKENLEKDSRLVNFFQAMLIPLRGDPMQFQKYNGHAAIITNSGTGKSEFYLIYGGSLNVDISIANLFGANFDEYSRKTKGSLDGSGVFWIDEIDQLNQQQYSKEIFKSLLGYLEQGQVVRKLKDEVTCEGTKTVVFVTNPSQYQDFSASVTKFLTLLQKDADPKRFAKRLGFFLAGNDFKTIDFSNANSMIRGSMQRLLNISCIKYWDSKILPIFKKGLQYADLTMKEDVDIRNTFLAKADTCPNVFLKPFVTGLSMGLPRVRFSAFRIAVLRHFSELVNRGYKACYNSVINDVESIYRELVNANLKSVDNLIIGADKLEPTKECACKIHSKFPSISAREIAVLLGVSHTQINRWLE